MTAALADRPLDPPEQLWLTEREVARIRDWCGDEFDLLGAGVQEWLADRPDGCVGIVIDAIWAASGSPTAYRHDAKLTLLRDILRLRDEYIEWREASVDHDEILGRDE